MARQKLTIDRIKKYALSPGKRQDFIWDSEVPALACRVTKGAKAFIFQSMYVGKYIRMTIGSVQDWHVEDARAEARRLQTLIDRGLDPRKEKLKRYEEAEKIDEEEKRGKVTFATAWSEYIEELKTGISYKTKRPYSKRYIIDHENLASRGGEKKSRGNTLTVAGPLAPLLDICLNGLSVQVITEWLQRERNKRPSNTAHAYRLLRAFTRWLNTSDKYANLVSQDTVFSDHVKKLVPSQSAKEGDCLQREQLKSWFSSVKKLSNPIHSVYLQALLLTGARREEMASLRWADIDFQWGSLRIKDKIEGERIIPLTPYLSKLLNSLPRLSDENGENIDWVFSSKTSRSGRITEPRISHNRALKIGELPHVSLHGLRRSFATLAEWVEVPTGVVAQIMGHKPSALAEKHYQRRSIDLLRKWHIKIERWIIEQAEIE